MSEYDRDAERARRRAEEACGAFEAPVSSACPRPDPRGRRDPSCDVPEPCVPDVTLSPTVLAPIVYPETVIPPVVSMRNAIPVVSCADLEGSPDKGGPVSPLSEILVEDAFDWTSVPGITDNQLAFISGLGEADILTVKTGDAVTIRGITRLTLAQSEYVVAALAAIQLALDEAARAAGLSLLDCWWGNRTQTVTCPSDDTLRETLIANIDERIYGLTPSATTQDIFTTVNHVTGTYVRNPACWAYGLDLTPISVFNSAGNLGNALGNPVVRIGFTLITPTLVLACFHAPPDLGSKIRWVTADNVMVERTITRSHDIGTAGAFPHPDVIVYELDSPVTGINPVTWLDARGMDLTGLPMLWKDQNHKAYVTQIDRLTSNDTLMWAHNESAHRAPWAKLGGPAPGDSGHAVCLVMDGRLVVALTWTSPTAGPNYTDPFLRQRLSVPEYDFTLVRAHDGTAQGDPVTVTVAQDSLTSTISQQDADNRALVLAESQLNCWWEATVEVSCPLGSTSPAGTTTATSTVSLAAAVEEAEAEAAVLRDPCMYANAELIVECDPAVYPLLISTDPQSVVLTSDNFDTALPANKVTISAGLFEAESQEEADEEAATQAEALLLCLGGHVEKSFTCPTTPYIDYLGNTVYRAPNKSKTLFDGVMATGDQLPEFVYNGPTVVVPANTFTSADGSAAADLLAEEALSILVATLECIYCNAEIPAECDTDVTVDGDSYVSYDKTRGVPENTICGRDISDVMVIAAQLGGVPAAIVEDTCLHCDYPVPAVTGRCIEAPGVEGVWPAKYAPQLVYERECLMPATTVTACDSFTQPEIVQTIMDAVKAQHAAARECPTCEFGNRLLRVYCGYARQSPDDAELRALLTGQYDPGQNSDNPLLYAGDGILFGGNELMFGTSPQDLSLNFGLISDPYIGNVYVEVPANRFKSNDPVQADMDAVRFAESTLICMYENPALRVYCGAEDADINDLVDSIKAQSQSPSDVSLSFSGGPISVLSDHATETSWEASGSLAGPAVIPQGQFTSDYALGETYDQALIAAIYAGLGLLDCYRVNDETHLSCTDFSDNGTPWLQPEGPEVRWDRDANGPANTVLMSRGLVSVTTSQAALDNLVKQYAESVLNCTYSNTDGQPNACGADETEMNNPVVPAGTVRGAASPADANDEATALADAMHVCLSPEQMADMGGGSPGGDGKQTDCQGECFGYYS